MNAAELETLSVVIGWSYFVCWSASFYPQIISNWRRKSVQGLSGDFCVLNAYGGTAYAIFTTYRYFWASQESLVQINDVVFALHAWLMTVITLSQMVVYRNTLDHGKFTFHFYVASYIALTFGVAVGWYLTGSFIDGYSFTPLLEYVSYIKLGCSTIKWLPQIYLNYTRKSTVGWSIGNILLDFIGGTLSIIQIFIDADRLDNWDGLLTDAIKWILGLVSMSFDAIFIVQHYVLYRHSYWPIADLPDIDILKNGHQCYGTVEDTPSSDFYCA